MSNPDPPGRIVVVDDDPTVADVVGRYLVRDGHTVECVHDGYEALRLVAEQPPDLIVLDLMLPGMDGLEVCRAVRSLAIDAQPMMVAVTGWGRSEDLRRTSEAGFDRHLVKPVQPDRLHEILSECARAGRRAVTVT